MYRWFIDFSDLFILSKVGEERKGSARAYSESQLRLVARGRGFVTIIGGEFSVLDRAGWL